MTDPAYDMPVAAQRWPLLIAGALLTTLCLAVVPALAAIGTVEVYLDLCCGVYRLEVSDPHFFGSIVAGTAVGLLAFYPRRR